MNHIILTDGTTINTSAESGTQFKIPLSSKDDFKSLLDKLSDETVRTVEVATAENVVISKLCNMQMLEVTMHEIVSDDGTTLYATLKLQTINKTQLQIEKIVETQNDIAIMVTESIYGEDEE